MTKIRSRDSRRIHDVRGRGSGRASGLPGGLDDLLGGGLGRGRAGGRAGGRGAGSGGGLPIPGGLMKGGGGIVMLLLLGAVFILPRLLGGGLGSAAAGIDQAPVAPATESSVADGETCSTELEQILCGATDDVAEYWVDQLPISFDTDYVETQTVFFSGSVDTACGRASAQTGPFYCPADSDIYFDLEFLVTLQDRFDATGDLAAQYIVAHEYGHHIQNVLGINSQVRRAQQEDPGRANQYSVALELQADCFAGAWAHDAADRDLFDRDDEIEEALNAAAAVGDDRIQQRTQGRIDPESWTHGSSGQRVAWFQRGFQTGDPQRCTTFSEVL